MKAIILHGKKLKKDGTLSEEVRNRMKIVQDLVKTGCYETVIITGGKTRANFSSEASAIHSNLRKCKEFQTVRILIEEQSRTTTENIKCVMSTYNFSDYEEIVVVTSKTALPRTKHLYLHHVGDTSYKLSFRGAQGNSSLIHRFQELILFAVAIVDPEGFIEKPFARIYR